MSQEMLSSNPCRLILDPHCQFTSASQTHVCHYFYSRNHLSLCISFPSSFSVSPHLPPDLWGPRQISYLCPKTKKQKLRACGQSNNALIYTVSIASQTGVPAKQEARLTKVPNIQYFSITWELPICKSVNCGL